MSLTSKRRSGFIDKENINSLNESESASFYEPHIEKPTKLYNYGLDESRDVIKDTFYKDEIRSLKSKNLYYQQMLTKLQNENKLTTNMSEIIKENADLKAAKEQHLFQIKKNEDMLIKAKDIIAHLKADIKLDTLSQNLFNNITNNTKTTKEALLLQDKIKTLEIKVNELENDNKLKDEHIEQLNKVISQSNVENLNLQKKLIKAIEKIKKLQQETETSKINDMSTIEYSQDDKNDLKKKLDSTMKYNHDLFSNYSELMKDNSNLQSKIFKLEQEVIKLRAELADKYNSVTMIKEAEYKLENIEANISKFEDSKLLMPYIEQKVGQLKKIQQDKIDLIKSGVNLLHDNLIKTLNNLLKTDNNNNNHINTSILSCFSLQDDTQFSYHTLMQSTKNEDIRYILDKMNIINTKILRSIIENIIRIIYSMFMEIFKNKIAKKLNLLDRKIDQIDSIKLMIFKQRQLSTCNNARSKSLLTGKRSYNQQLFFTPNVPKDEGIIGLLKTTTNKLF